MQSADTLKAIRDTLLNEGHLRKIQEFTQETASNTAFSFWREADFWEYMAIGLSVVAILLSVVTAISQWKTERNTRMSLNMKTQVYESILKLLLRDLYRIQCDLLALQIILKEDNFQSYPVERCLKNMTIKFDDSNLDSFLVVFNVKCKNEAVERYLMMQEINGITQDYNVDVAILIDHLKDSSIDINTKSSDFSILYNRICVFSHKIIETAKVIYGKNSDVSSYLSRYAKSALDYFLSGEDYQYFKDFREDLKKYNEDITPILSNYFKMTDVVSVEDLESLAYGLISLQIKKNDSRIRRSLIKFNP